VLAVGVITNPHSGKNRNNPDRRVALQRAVGRHGIVRETQELDDLGDVVDELIDAGCRHWVCDGGDGTLHWLISVADARLRARRDRGDDVVWPSIVPGNGGSIDFVAHKAGIRGDAAELARKLVDRVVRGDRLPMVALDTMRMRGTHRDGSMFEHLGFASAIGGIAQRVFGKLYERRPVDGWTIARMLGKSAASAVVGNTPGLSQLVSEDLRDFTDELFSPTRARVAIDGRTLAFDSFMSLQVGSIDINLGGVVRTFRLAHAPGVMHAQALCATPLGVVANLPNIVFGTPIWGRNVFDGPTRTMSVTAFDGESIDPVIDGEMFHGFAELRIERGPTLDVPRLHAA
jgi:diacylglycerol kinase family enzyme